MKRAKLVLGIVLLAGGGLVIACGDDDDGGTTPAVKDAGSTVDAGPTGDSGSDGTPDAGPVDSGADAADAGPQPLGAACTTNAGCESNVCFGGGTGGGPASTGAFCSLVCANKDSANDPTCTAHPEVFTGKCNRQGYCQKGN